MKEYDHHWFNPAELAAQEAKQRAAVDGSPDHDGPGDYGAYRKFFKYGLDDRIRAHAIIDDEVAALYAAQVKAVLPGGEPRPARLSVLDIGSGPGTITDALRVALPADVLGVDGSEDATEYARRQFPRCKFETLWIADALPGRYDVIHSRSFYPFARSADRELHLAFLDLFARHLNPGGHVVLNVYGGTAATATSAESFCPASELTSFDLPSGGVLDVRRHVCARFKIQAYFRLGIARTLSRALSAAKGVPNTYFYVGSLRKP